MSRHRCIRVSAPGKLLLFGEHAVVYGSAAIATALSDVRVQVAIQPLEAPSESSTAAISFAFRAGSDGADTHKSFSVTCSQLRELLERFPHDQHYVPQPAASLVQAIHQMLDPICRNEEECRMFCPAVFMACALLRSTSNSDDCWSSGLLVEVQAQNFPIGAGLGSSAAFCVALAGGFFVLTHHQRIEMQRDGKRLSKTVLDAINQFAFAGEVLLHGSPSGVDNFTSTFGGSLLFRKTATADSSLAKMEMQFLRKSIDSLRFLIVNTGVPRSTSQQVANVRAFYDANPPLAKQFFDEIDSLSKTFLQLVDSEQLTETRVAEMMQRNQQLLQQMGVSHERIEQVVQLTQMFGVATKLTGAGGGGCTVSLISRSFEESQVQKLMEALAQEGFEVFVTSVGGTGFEIHQS